MLAVTSPLGADGAGHVSRDGRIAFASLQFEPGAQLGGPMQDAVVAAAQPARAAGVTLLTALVAAGVGLALIVLLARFLTVPTFSPTLALMLGLGAGIDYSLLMVARYRTNLAEDDDPAAALARANATAGRSVLLAGSIVMVAIAALLASGIDLIGRMGLAAAVAVGSVALGAVTLTPLLMALLGRRLAPRNRHAGGSAGFTRWSRMIERRRGWAALVAVLALAALAAPNVGMRLGTPDEGNQPAGTTKRIAYDRLTEGFGPGFNGPLLLAVTPATPGASLDQAALAGLQKRPGRDVHARRTRLVVAPMAGPGPAPVRHRGRRAPRPEHPTGGRGGR